MLLLPSFGLKKHTTQNLTSLVRVCSWLLVVSGLQEALVELGANYTAHGPPMTGHIDVRVGASDVVTLDLADIPLRLFAVELATLHRTVQDVIEEKTRRSAQLQLSSLRHRQSQIQVLLLTSPGFWYCGNVHAVTCCWKHSAKAAARCKVPPAHVLWPCCTGHWDLAANCFLQHVVVPQNIRLNSLTAAAGRHRHSGLIQSVD